MQFVLGIKCFRGEASESGAYTAEDYQLAGFLETFGPFPPSLLKQGRRASQYFDEQGSLPSYITHCTSTRPSGALLTYLDLQESFIDIPSMWERATSELPKK